MFRALVPFLALLLLVSACSNDGAGRGAAGAGGIPDDTATAGQPTSTEVSFAPAPLETIETPFSIPPLDPDEETADKIDIMLDEALDDGEVTADEIAAVLEVAGLNPELARCEAVILFELVVEDLGGIVDLQRAVDARTADQTTRLQACFAQ